MAANREQLSITVEKHEHRMLIRLRGELDTVTAPALADVLSRSNSEIVVDFADLTFLDVVNAGTLVQRMFQLTGLDHLLAGTDAPN